VLLFVAPLSAQTRRGGQGGQGGPRIYRDHVDAHWSTDGKRFWYRNDLPGGKREFIIVDADKAKRSPAFDSERLAKALSEKLGHEVNAEKLPIEFLDFPPDEKSLDIAGSSDAWRLNLTTYELSKIDRPAPPPTQASPARRGGGGGGGARGRNPAARSPDGKYEAFVRDNNLWIRSTDSRDEFSLTTDATPKDTYHHDVYRDRAISMNFTRPEATPTAGDFYWSPDSSHMVAMRTHTVAGRTVYEVQSSPTDQLQPKLQSFPYLKAGDEIPISKPHLFDIGSRKEVSVSDTLFANPWEISQIRWSKDSSGFTLLFNQRGHQALRILAVDAHSGDAKPIIDEHSDTFIDYSGKMFVEYLDDTNEIVWMSERDGWNHLYLYDSQTGKVKNQITKGEWVVRRVDRVDREKRQIIFQAGGIVPGQDPYYLHVCRVNFDGTGLTVLTEGDGTHTVEWSPDRKLLIDTFSRVDAAPVTELRRAQDGKYICRLEEADISDILAAHRPLPERFVAKGRDNTTDIYGVIFRPRDFDASKKYPIVEDIYAGPHDSFVPKAFRPSYGHYRIADLGFIVVQIDGMGTSNRSKAFHDVCWKNLADAGFADRIPWIKAAAAKYPYMDLTRVGIYGGSAGGQNALAGLLLHGDFYKVGVADCGCHDNRMDKIWWNEQWMGYPVGPEYAASSNVTHASKLTGKLLLMIGELDHNVDPSSTMQVINALEKARKDFDFVIVAGAGHGSAETPYGSHRRAQFLVRHLLGKDLD
jgi:dipeptidyl aminopeptidase/acylaminoacyl peptidase